jgi:hypothetical protein
VRGLCNLHRQITLAAELLDRLLGIIERLAVLTRLVLHGLDAATLLRAREDHARAAGRLDRVAVGAVDRVEVVSVDLDRVPPERLGAVSVALDIPAQHRLACLRAPVDIDDRGQTVQPLPPRVLEGLPDRTLRHLRISAQHPDPLGQAVQQLAGDRDADSDG